MNVIMAGLAVLGIVTGISINNELRIIKIDCYERLAIGQRLKSDKVYRSYTYNTVGDCKKACSEEKSTCKSFSFGIAAKGNATCELSSTPIKEPSLDSKPDGTVPDVDFDLYLKKGGCTIVSEDSPHHRPLEDDLNKANTLGNVHSDGIRHQNDGIHNVQTLVSIAHGPESVFNPVHGIIVASDDHKHNYETEPLNAYDDHKQQEYYTHRPHLNNFETNVGYDETIKGYRPHQYSNIDRYDQDFKFNRYGDKMSDFPYRSKSDYARPTPDKYGSYIPHPNDYYKRPTHEDYPYPSYKPGMYDNSEYQHNRPYEHVPKRPIQENSHYGPKPAKPVSLALIYELEDSTTAVLGSNRYPLRKPTGYGSMSTNFEYLVQGTQQYTTKPITTHSTGYNGAEITSIITEIKEACFRRVLAGKRISSRLIRRALACETVEECQRECAEEKFFSCEGFNYRLDPSGRAKGDCELLSLPLSRLDVYRDSYPDRDYDYYERDRNAAAENCRQGYRNRPYKGHYNYDDNRYGIRDEYSYGSSSSDRWSDRRYDHEAPRPSITYHGSVDYKNEDRWKDDYYRKPVRPEIDRRYDYDDNNRRRGDYSYLPFNSNLNRNENRRYFNDRILPPKPLSHDQYDRRAPPDDYKYHKKYDWGIDNYQYGYPAHKDTYVPQKANVAWNYGDWGQDNRFKDNYSYWGINKYGGNYDKPADRYLPPEPALLPPKTGSYLPKPLDGGTLAIPESALLPVEHRRPSYSHTHDDCSLRSVTGFKLHKRIVKKYVAVPNIYECELLCFKETAFLCASYAYRYTTTITEPTDNCYLSNLNYKELDHYTDLEPDRDFDVYTMNDKNRCDQPLIERRDNSDCFWRVRSGERLHHKIVRDTLKSKSAVDCQVECLTSTKFTCRSFSYRYGPPIIGGSIDNCQLTDWPYYELDPKIHFIPEPGFEVYERGSYGHGCETGHFGVRGHVENPRKQINSDQLCYIGFGSPARLLHQAIKKSVRVTTELECKEECSRARMETLFQCMSFSFWFKSPRSSPNCDLSDIYQRDLLAKLDYVYDPNALLFAWDNYNPDCVALANDPVHSNHISGGPTDRDYYTHALDTWRVYSVNGWPCKRGAKCTENIKAGFWFCEIEGGGESGAWDYCCRPDHQCGASSGYPYLWCYVGPVRTQWRRCNDRYYPYMHHTDRFDDDKYFTSSHSRPWKPSNFRPDRLPAQSPIPPPKPSLDQYEMIFDEEFLEPPKPGGLGQARHWPVSYLHKEMPPNVTDSRLLRMETEDPKYSAIQNLIDVIKNNDLDNIQYQISNASDKRDDILFVKIPLPTNFTSENTNIPDNSTTTVDLEPVNLDDGNNFAGRRFQKSLPQFVTKEDIFDEKTFERSLPVQLEWSTQRGPAGVTENLFERVSRPLSAYRRGFIERTNVSSYGKHS